MFRYTMIDGTPTTQAADIAMMLKGKAELGFVSVDTNPPPPHRNGPFDLTVRIENTQTSNAKQVSAKVDLPVEGIKEAFIGNITPGNDAPALFLLEGMKGGDYPYNLTIPNVDDMGAHALTRQMNKGYCLLTIPAISTPRSSSLLFWDPSLYRLLVPALKERGRNLPMGKKELKVAFLLALRSLQRGSRSSVILTVLIIGMCFTNMIFLPSLFNGIEQSITKQTRGLRGRNAIS